MAKDRKPDVEFQMNRLEQKHAELSARVSELDRRMSLSPHDHLLVTELKKQKLATKDALRGLKRNH